MATPLGSRIDMRFGVDVLDETTTFPEDSFDYVVLSHCSWYFASLGQLQRTFARSGPSMRRRCRTRQRAAPVLRDHRHP